MFERPMEEVRVSAVATCGLRGKQLLTSTERPVVRKFGGNSDNVFAAA
jgi:hypothetical protein